MSADALSPAQEVITRPHRIGQLCQQVLPTFDLQPSETWTGIPQCVQGKGTVGKLDAILPGEFSLSIFEHVGYLELYYRGNRNIY